MKTLLVGDIHITESNINEIDNIFTKDIFSLNADRIILLGDLFDKNRPTPYELKYGTHLIRRLVEKYIDVTILAGNGSHEFLNNVAIIEYLKDLDAKIITDDHFILDNIYYGHFMLYESRLAYGSGKCGIKDLKQYKWVFLGHQHNPQKLSDTIFHLGSIRYCNFNEVTDTFKQVAIVDGNKIEFIPLKSPIKMIDVKSLEELPNIDANSKVRLVISSFAQFKKEINEISKYKDKFIEFKVKMNFEKDLQVAKEIKSNKKLEEILEEGINRIEDEDVKKLLKESLR
jgi:DNA repair exonuclease SbcCD nuclease subunit